MLGWDTELWAVSTQRLHRRCALLLPHPRPRPSPLLSATFGGFLLPPPPPFPQLVVSCHPHPLRCQTWWLPVTPSVCLPWPVPAAYGTANIQILDNNRAVLTFEVRASEQQHVGITVSLALPILLGGRGEVIPLCPSGALRACVRASAT